MAPITSLALVSGRWGDGQPVIVLGPESWRYPFALLQAARRSPILAQRVRQAFGRKALYPLHGVS